MPRRLRQSPARPGGLSSVPLLVFAHSVLKEQGRDPYAEVQRLPLALRWGLYYLVIFMAILSFICVNETVGSSMPTFKKRAFMQTNILTGLKPRPPAAPDAPLGG